MVRLFTDIATNEVYVLMGYIHCCAGLRKTRSFELVPAEGFVVCKLDKLVKCPVCGHYVIQLTRLDNSKSVSVVRMTNSKAKKFWKKIKNEILYEEKDYDYTKMKGSFYLNYNEYGIKKRCYSNLSNMKLGIS